MELKDVPVWISAIASVVLAFGLILTFWQVRLVKRLAIMQFEDSIGREYRELAARLPANALLGIDLNDNDLDASLDHFIHYIDLSNEQVFLRRCGRISRTTWENWCEGIRSNLEQSAFKKAWTKIKEKSANFRELRRLESDGFASDPADWGPDINPKATISRTGKS